MDGCQGASLEQTEHKIRSIYDRDPDRAAAEIEQLLQAELSGCSASEQIEVLARLKSSFGGAASQLPQPQDSGIDEKTLRTLLSRLLRKSSVRADLPAEQMLDKMTDAMTLIFETLNQLVAAIQATLFGKSPDLETIRYVIGSTLDEDGTARSIEEFLDQIRDAFLISHQAFQLAAREKVEEILQELEPAGLLDRASSGLRRGPFGKAEAFEIFREKHEIIGQWLTSERFQHDLLRAFETQCLRLYTKREENP